MTVSLKFHAGPTDQAKEVIGRFIPMPATCLKTAVFFVGERDSNYTNKGITFNQTYHF
jgi:hypothetical protein